MSSKFKNNVLSIPLTILTSFEDDDDDINEASTLLKDSSKNYLLFEDLAFDNHQKKNVFFKEMFIKLKSWQSKNVYSNIKSALLFIILMFMTILIAISKEQPFDYHDYSVSRPFTQIYNESIPKYASLVRFRFRGPLLLGTLKEHSNISIIVTNVQCSEKYNESSAYFKSNCRAEWTVGVLNSNIEHEKETYLTKYFSLEPGSANSEILIEFKTKSFKPIPIGMNMIFLTYSIEYQILYSALILLSVYILIIFDLVHRSVAAILGSLAAIATLSTLNLRPSLATIISWLDFDTLNLLFGMMLIVGIFAETGFFDWIAFKAFKLARGKPWPLLILLCTVSAVVSAFLDNVTTVLLLTPVSIRLCEALKIDPKKVLIAEVLFSNIGGTATAIGDPPNVIIVSSDELRRYGVNFANFTLHLATGSLFILIISLLFLKKLYGEISSIGDEDSYRLVEIKREIEVWRRSAFSITIASQEEATVRALLLEKVVNLEHELGVQKHVRRPSVHFRETIKDMEEKYCIKDKWLLVKCSIVLGIVIVSFFLSSLVPGFYLDLGWIAFFGAIWIIILSDTTNLEVILDKVEWATLIFFAALFALMRALEELNLIAWIGKQISDLILTVPEDYRLLVSIILILWISALASSFIDNIPFTTAMIPVVIELGSIINILPLVWALAFGACLGGNGTLIGASANVVVAGIAQQHGYSFTFTDFLKVGFPMMILSTFIAMIYLIICHVLIGWNLS